MPDVPVLPQGGETTVTSDGECCCGSGGGSMFPPTCCCEGTIPDTLCVLWEWSSVNIFGTVCFEGSTELMLTRCGPSGSCSPCNNPDEAESCWCWRGSYVQDVCKFPAGTGDTTVALEEFTLCCDFSCEFMVVCLKWSGIGPLGEDVCCFPAEFDSEQFNCDPFDLQVDADLTLSSVFFCRDSGSKQFFYNYRFHITECA